MTKAQPSTAPLAQLVTAVQEALEPIKGLKLTSSVVFAAATLVKQVLPWASRELLIESLYPPLLRGVEITDAVIEDRARNCIQALTGGIS